MSSRFRASIVVVNYNGGDMLSSCLSSVFCHTPDDVEVLVVDNSSTDGSCATVGERFPRARLMFAQENLGYSGGNNLGVSESSADGVILLNNDAEVTAGWFEPLVAALTGDVVAVTSRVETDGIPAAWYEMNGTMNPLGYNIMRHFSDRTRVFYAGGTALAFRKSVTGVPFPDEYFLYQEDVHLSWRLRMRGFDVRMVQASRVVHRGSATSNRQPSRFITFYQERNRLLNLLIFHSCRTLIALAPWLVLDAVAKLFLSMIGKGKNAGGIMQEYWWMFSHAGWIRMERRRRRMERCIDDAKILELMSAKLLEGDGMFSRLAEVMFSGYLRLTTQYRLSDK